MRTAVDHRESILNAAATLFARKPFHAVLMDDVAEALGIAKGTIYRHFPNKSMLFGAVSMRYMEMIGTELGRVADGDGAPLVRLKRMVRRMVELIRENQDFFNVMQRYECELWANHESEFLARREVLRGHVVRVLREAQASKQIHCPFDLTQAADMLLGMVRNLLRFSGRSTKPENVASMVVHLFVNGTRPIANNTNGNGSRNGSKHGA